jgi:hypothetical protein
MVLAGHISTEKTMQNQYTIYVESQHLTGLQLFNTDLLKCFMSAETRPVLPFSEYQHGNWYLECVNTFLLNESVVVNLDIEKLPYILLLL